MLKCKLRYILVGVYFCTLSYTLRLITVINSPFLILIQLYMWEMMLYMIPIHILYEYTGMVNIYFILFTISIWRITREVISNDILIVLQFNIFNFCLSTYWCNRGIVRQIISPITSVTFKSHLRRKSILEKFSE